MTAGDNTAPMSPAHRALASRLSAESTLSTGTVDNFHGALAKECEHADDGDDVDAMDNGPAHSGTAPGGRRHACTHKCRVRLLPIGEYRRMPWKNGMGVTE